MGKLISVVIATYRRPELLLNCLDALAYQSMPAADYEVIVVTDGPDLQTARSIAAFCETIAVCPDIHCISLATKRGPAAARNAGWHLAQGRLIVFTDDDCLPNFHCLQNYWQAFQPHVDAPIAFTGKVRVPRSDVPTDYEKNISHLETASFVTANCACSAKALQFTGGLDEQFTMAWREDTALEFDLISSGIPIIRVPAAVVVHPVRKAGFGVSIREQKKSMFNALLYRRHESLYEEANVGRPPVFYYLAVTAMLFTVAGALWQRTVMMVALTIWLSITAAFTAYRLRDTSHKLMHVLEMLYTSAIIPFVSVFWNLYGSIKFKKLLI